MGWTRHTGAVVSVALLASVAGHFAVQRQFEARQRRFEAVVPGTPYLTALPRTALEFMPPPLLPSGGLLASDENESSAVPRYLGEFDRPARVGQVVPALQVRGDDEPVDGSSGRRTSGGETSNQAPPRTVPEETRSVRICGQKAQRPVSRSSAGVKVSEASSTTIKPNEIAKPA